MAEQHDSEPRSSLSPSPREEQLLVPQAAAVAWKEMGGKGTRFEGVGGGTLKPRLQLSERERGHSGCSRLPHLPIFLF